MSITAMKQALEALEANVGSYHPLRRNAITALRTAIEEAEKQEPVAERFEAMHANGDVWITTIAAAQIARNTTPPYVATPLAAQPALKPLTNEQIGKAARDAHIAFCLNKHQTYEHALTRAIEAAHGITAALEKGQP
jgi:hypothetical protein